MFAAFDRKPEEGVAADLVACGFPTDVGEGGVNLAIPLVSAIEYVYPRWRAHQNATHLSINLVIKSPQWEREHLMLTSFVKR